METLRILTWNVLFEIRDAAPLRAEERHPEIFARACAPGVHVAAFQELTPWSLRALGGFSPCVLPSEPGAVEPYGVGLASPVAPSEHRSWRLRTGKAVLLARYLFEGDPVWVMNLHLSSDLHAGAAGRREEEVAEAMAALPARDAAVVLGDLNCSADARPLALGAHGLREVWSALYPGDPGYTWDPVGNSIARGIYPDGQPRRLDAIFWRAGPRRLAPVRAERIQGVTASGLPFSDHDGVVADFVWER